MRESRFIMASSSFSDAPNPETSEAEAKSVTIVINDNGEINYDEKTLQSIIGKSKVYFAKRFWYCYFSSLFRPHFVIRILLFLI